MAILKIARMGHPVLLARARPVADPAAPEIERLIADLIETMADAGGTGLAAPQVHASMRIVVYRIDAERQAREDEPDESEPGEDEPHGARPGGDEPGEPLTVLINPEIEPLSDDMAFAWEACLSVPDLAGKVPRHTHIRLRYQTTEGEAVVREASGFHARVLQHECDHLDGVLYPMRIEDLSEFGFVEDLNRAAEVARQAAADD